MKVTVTVEGRDLGEVTVERTASGGGVPARQLRIALDMLDRAVRQVTAALHAEPLVAELPQRPEQPEPLFEELRAAVNGLPGREGRVWSAVYRDDEWWMVDGDPDDDEHAALYADDGAFFLIPPDSEPDPPGTVHEFARLPELLAALTARALLKPQDPS